MIQEQLRLLPLAVADALPDLLAAARASVSHTVPAVLGRIHLSECGGVLRPIYFSAACSGADFRGELCDVVHQQPVLLLLLLRLADGHRAEQQVLAELCGFDVIKTRGGARNSSSKGRFNMACLLVLLMSRAMMVVGVLV